MRIYTKESLQNKDKLQTVSDVLEHSSLQMILQKAKMILAVDALLHKVVKTEFAAHCKVLNIKGNRVIVGVSNASIATRLKFDSCEIVEGIRKEFAEIGYVDFRMIGVER